jgi:hypothetical protein
LLAPEAYFQKARELRRMCATTSGVAVIELQAVAHEYDKLGEEAEKLSSRTVLRRFRRLREAFVYYR